MCDASADSASPAAGSVEAFPPPARLSARAKDAWREVVAVHGDHAARVVGPLLEVYCEAVGRAREAHERVAEEGMIIADPRGAPISHPALAIAKAAEATVDKLAPRFQPRVERRGDGYMVRAFGKAVRAAGLDEQPEYSAAVAATRTLALVIDNAQEEGVDALRRSAFGPIPTFLKAVKDLGLTPTLAQVDEAAGEGDGPGAVVTSIDGWMQKNG